MSEKNGCKIVMSLVDGAQVPARREREQSSWRRVGDVHAFMIGDIIAIAGNGDRIAMHRADDKLCGRQIGPRENQKHAR